MDLLSVIIKPVHSEKTYFLRNLEPKKYVFEVNKDANKYEINMAFQLIYGIVPLKINVLKRKPVPTRTGTRKPGSTKLKKFAYITLPIGVDIQLEEDATDKNKDKKEAKAEKKEEKKLVGKLTKIGKKQEEKK
ncbi:MAG: 50S ribosomal protein L23 [Malacoplasma sp.]|nr:50S ribosomal protein L23 [Malacoplasma sp.]